MIPLHLDELTKCFTKLGIEHGVDNWVDETIHVTEPWCHYEGCDSWLTIHFQLDTQGIHHVAGEERNPANKKYTCSKNMYIYIKFYLFLFDYKVSILGTSTIRIKEYFYLWKKTDVAIKHYEFFFTSTKGKCKWTPHSKSISRFISKWKIICPFIRIFLFWLFQVEKKIYHPPHEIQTDLWIFFEVGLVNLYRYGIPRRYLLLSRNETKFICLNEFLHFSFKSWEKNLPPSSRGSDDWQFLSR